MTTQYVIDDSKPRVIEYPVDATYIVTLNDNVTSEQHHVFYDSAVREANTVMSDLDLHITSRSTSIGGSRRTFETLEGPSVVIHKVPFGSHSGPEVAHVHFIEGYADKRRQEFLDAYQKLWDDLEAGGPYPEHLVFFDNIITAYATLGMGGTIHVSITWNYASSPLGNAQALFNKVGEASA